MVEAVRIELEEEERKGSLSLVFASLNRNRGARKGDFCEPGKSEEYAPWPSNKLEGGVEDF